MAWELKIRREIFNDTVGCLLVDRDRDVVVRPLVLEKEAMPSPAPIQPTYEARTNEFEAMLQAIVNAAWDYGIKPVGVDEWRRVNDAKSAHLRDMRALVSKALKTELPE